MMVINYKKLNDNTYDDAYKIPNKDSLINSIQGQIQKENQNNIDILKEIQKRQIKSVEKLNTILGIRKEAGRL